jgi:hypothetical protein
MAKARSLTQFQQTFPDEAACAAFLFERRWPNGFVCPGCDARRKRPPGAILAARGAFLLMVGHG